MYKLCVFAGTTEGRALVELLAGQPVAVTACVATEYGGALLEPRENLTVSRERLTREEMEELFTREGFALVVDATHPYAPWMSGTHTAPSGTSPADRSSRRYSVPVPSQAAAMFSVTAAA